MTEEEKNIYRQKAIISNRSVYNRWKEKNRILLDWFLLEELRDIFKGKNHEPNS